MEPGRIPTRLELDKGNLAEEWRVWLQNFEWYLQGEGKEDAPGATKVGRLMFCAGKDAQETFATFDLSAADKGDYKKVVDAFEKYCNPRKRILFERHIFTNAKQEGPEGPEGENVDKYLTKLKSLVKQCEYTNPDEMLRDQFVFGLRDSGPGGVMERLFREENVTLKKAVDFARASEASKAQMAALREKEKQRKMASTNPTASSSRSNFTPRVVVRSQSHISARSVVLSILRETAQHMVKNA